MTEIYVSSKSELLSALSSANSGDVLLLGPGQYGAVDLSNIRFNDYVTIRSADPNNEAVFQNIEFNNSSHIRVDDVVVDKGSNSGARLVEIYASDNIDFVNSEVFGDGPEPGTYGIWTHDGSNNLTITNNYVHDLNVGITSFSTSNVTISENYVDYVYSDYFKFGGVEDVLFENNTGGGHTFPGATTHSDFVQFQGSASDVIIRGNVFLAQNNERPQGIFLADAYYENILIEQNIIYSGKLNAIRVTDGSGIVVQNNTLLSPPYLGHNAAVIIVPDGSIVENNIYSNKTGEISGSNVVLQYRDPDGAYHYDDLFVNADVGLGVTLEDLLPVPGSLAETKGAYDRLMELINGTPYEPEPYVPSTDPTPTETGTGTETGAETPDEADQSQFEAGQLDGTALSLLGTQTFNRSSDVVEIAHNSDLAMRTGTISLTFNADTVSGRLGLLSKDASGYAGGGNHLAAYIENGVLTVRFQDGSSDTIAKIPGIQAGREYDLQITFGDSETAVWLDGQQAWSGSSSISLDGNVEHLQVGALGWASSSGQSGYSNVFDGTISDVVIAEGKWTPDQIQDLIYNSKPLPEETNTQPDTTDSEPDTPDVPVSTDADIVFELDQVEFGGRKKGIINLDHDENLELAEGTISFTFNADDLSGRQGLFSKDASGYVGGDHVSVLLQGDSLLIRYQDGSNDANLTFEDVEANQDYDVRTWFDGDEIGLSVNGELIETRSFDFDLLANQQNLQIGGLGWSSTDGGDRVSNAFDGTISDVTIWDDVVLAGSVDLFA